VVALVFGSGFFAKSLRRAIRKVPGSAVPIDAFKTHYALEGLIVSKCGCMDVKRLALT
jgi:hypothetical protein